MGDPSAEDRARAFEIIVGSLETKNVRLLDALGNLTDRIVALDKEDKNFAKKYPVLKNKLDKAIELIQEMKA